MVKLKRWLLVLLVSLLLLASLLFLCVHPLRADSGGWLGGFEYFNFVKAFEQTADFQSLPELEYFLREDDTNTHIFLVAREDGVIELNRQCVQQAMQLRNRAFVKGKYLSLQVLDYDKPISHMICMAVIGRNIYFVEPSTDRVWLNSYRGDR